MARGKSIPRLPELPEKLRRLAHRLAPWVPALALAALVGRASVGAILERAGEPALPLDDAFIHFQYARRLAEGRFFSYAPGDPATSGATSLLWPALLAPFWALGFRGTALAWPAWALGWLAHAALAVETARLAERLAGRAAALGAGAMCLAFGGYAWFASSGMETLPFAWALVRAARLSAAWTDAEPGERSDRRLASLCFAGALPPLLRPEGALASLLAASAIALRPSRRPGARLFTLGPIAGAALPPLLHLALTGQARSATAQVKWLLGNPSYEGQVGEIALGNAKFLLSSVLGGGEWTAIFVPEGSAPFFVAGIAALAVAGIRRGPGHALATAVLLAATFVPCTYLSFLWNRLRYVWPFLPAWFVALACLCREVAELCRRVDPRAAGLAPLLAGAYAGALAQKLPGAIRDLAESADAIARQQVALGRWAAEALPEDAVVGVNDTGAIAYFSERKTFDVVGLTTRGEARHWVAGAGSRFEHYERLGPAKLPTHFVVYPEWMACPPVLGRALTSRSVFDQSILGGVTMVAYEARYDLLGSGERPASLPNAKVADAVDVADLESERAHDFRGEPLSDSLNIASVGPAPEPPGAPEAPLLADGGRAERVRERFGVLAGGRRLVLRAAAEEGASLEISVNGALRAKVELGPGDWQEPAVDLGHVRHGDAIEVVAARGRFTSYHYWLLAE